MNSSRQSEMNDTADFEFTPLQKSILLELKKKKKKQHMKCFWANKMCQASNKFRHKKIVPDGRSVIKQGEKIKNN